MRLIDADALLAAFEKDISEQTKHMELLKSVGDMKHYYDISKVQIGMVSCRRMLENAPIIIDAVPTDIGEDIDEILRYLDAVVHPLLSPENWNVYAQLHDMVSSIDAVPVKHAKLLDASPWGLCSECGFMMDYRENFNYCPNCGARMDGEEK